MTCNFFSLANKHIQLLEPYSPGKPITELERECGVNNIIKLASNENPLPISKKITTAIHDALIDINRYPDGNGFDLKHSLVKKHGVDFDQITLGNGSNEILELVARVFLNKDKEAIFSQYAFAVYPIVVQAVGAKAVITPAKNWEHDLTAMLDVVTDKTAVVFIANPNNPTGTWIDEVTLTNFLDQLPEHVIVVLDEAYFDYVEEDTYPDGISLLSRYQNLVVTRTFSKAYGLSGLRVGYGISNPVIAELLNRARQPFNVNHIALIAAIASIEDSETIKNVIKLNSNGMKQLTGGLNEMNLTYIPSVANFIAIEFGSRAPELFKALLQVGIIVRPMASYNMPNFLRVTIGTYEENQRFLSYLRQSL